MQINIEEITPEKASKMLELNTGNFRILDHGRINRYAKSIQEGSWELNGESIKFNGSKLIDGQHRLHAVIKAGESIRTVVANDIQSEGLSIDTGKSRNLGQWCRHKGYPNYSHLPTIALHLIRYEDGKWDKSRGDRQLRYCVSNTELLKMIEENLDRITQSIKVARACKKIVSINQLAPVIFIGGQDVDIENSKWINWFVHAIKDGAGLDEKSPVFHFRKKMVDSLMTNKKYSRDTVRIMATLAWNLSVDGEQCGARKMNVMFSGPKKTAIPKTINKLTQEMSDLEY